ncbi:MAG: methionyl-tRNA formyltransferase [Bacteroidetes bacterium]|nr:methionyl-tRNA formyltransferase [Bacteroidota bacterium]
MNSLSELRVVFFGTPDFAVASLRALLDVGVQVLAVVTAPDKPAGRGRQVHETAVKQFALERNLPLLQPLKLKAAEFISQLQALHADVHIVVAFRMLPEAVWNMPLLGTINVHASLLPQYRGAAPINWALIHGDQETGVTTFRLKHAIDTGNILLQQRVGISEEDDAGSLHDKLMLAGAALLVETLQGIVVGSLEGQPQKESSELHHAPKIFREDCLISWQQSGHRILNFVRGLAPHPTAHTSLEGKMLKVFRVHVQPAAYLPAPGSHESDGKSYLRFAAEDAWVYLDELQLEGKKRMDIEAFLRGFRV